MKQKIKKSTIAIISIGCASCIALGIFAGTFIGKLVFVQEVDYSNLNALELEDNTSSLMNRYQKLGSLTLSEYQNKFKPYELANIALNNMAKETKVRSVGKGLVLADVNGIKVNQDIRSNYVRVDDMMFSESISASSMVKVAKRFYQDKTQVKYYNGKYVELEACDFQEKHLKQSYTLSEFEDTWGRDFSRPTIYIVSSKTVKKSECRLEDGKLKIDMELDPITSVVRYVKQIVMTSDLKKPPVFEKVNLSFTIKDGMMLESTDTDEVYKTFFSGVWAKTSGTLHEERHYNEDIVKIPEISENANYQ